MTVLILIGLWLMFNAGFVAGAWWKSTHVTPMRQRNMTGTPKGTSPQDRERAVVRAAISWWRSHRPLAFGVRGHLLSPTVNLSTAAEKRLAVAVAEHVRGESQQGGASGER